MKAIKNYQYNDSIALTKKAVNIAIVDNLN